LRAMANSLISNSDLDSTMVSLASSLILTKAQRKKVVSALSKDSAEVS